MSTVRANETAPVREPADRWSIAEAGELYDVASWGKGYFAVEPNGHVWVRPDKDPARGIDLKELVDNLQLEPFQSSRRERPRIVRDSSTLCVVAPLLSVAGTCYAT